MQVVRSAGLPRRESRSGSGWAVALLVVALVPAGALADAITTNNILPTPQHVVGSGNGTLDLRMFTHSGSEIQNTGGTFDGDNGNNALPQGGGADILFFNESYVTTAGELKAFYDLNFSPPGSIHNLVIFLDLNETGNGQPTNTLERLDIILNPVSIQGNPNPFADISSAGQTTIQQICVGGTTIAWLNPQPADNLPVNDQGAGHADYAIYTGIDPFALNDNDVLLFNVSMSHLNNGAEEIFLSGTYSPSDIPEPSVLMLSGLAAIILLILKQRR